MSTAALHNHPTRYEVELHTADGRRFLVGYTPRRSFTGLLAAVRKMGKSILAITNLPEDATTSRNGTALGLGYGHVIRFTGRTQRDAIVGGELPFVGRAC
jgi:hypothetical protein